MDDNRELVNAKKNWDCIAPFCGFATPGQGFYFIKSASSEQGAKELANCAMITMTAGILNARRLESNFKALSGPSSNWWWYAKKISDIIFQMRFPSSRKIEELSYFTKIHMRTDPSVVLRWISENPQ
uniref:Uncharacterized protein n=1 Tax=Arundo donax TaxID=35708 RepID=A0A0A9FMS3_ARUDO